MSKAVLIIKTKTKPGKREEVRRLFEKHLGPRAQQNPKQELVVWCADDKDADVFYLFEIYSDPSAPQANAQAPWFFEYLQQVQPLISDMSEVMSATPLWAKGIAL